MTNKFVFNRIAIDNLTITEAVEKINKMIVQCEKGYIFTVNAAHFLYLRNDSQFLEAYNSCSLILADGMSLVFASKLLGKSLKEKCSGVDLFYTICRSICLKNIRIFILGGTRGSEKITRDKLLESNPGLEVDAYSPRMDFGPGIAEDKEVCKRIRTFKPDLLLVFLGSPKSEKWIYNNFSSLNGTIAISLGASLDYFSGVKKRAPVWMQRIGLEWFYRLYREPHRLWKRYLFGNFYFFLLLLKEFFFKGKKGAI